MSAILQRHQDKWVPEPNSGCYLWVGALAGNKCRQPRPRVEIAGKKYYVSRLVCEEAYGSMDGYLACHKSFCGNFLCVNPDHLYRGTASDNMMDIPQFVRLVSSKAATAALIGGRV